MENLSILKMGGDDISLIRYTLEDEASPKCGMGLSMIQKVVKA